MWTRKQLKDKAKTALKRNYWKTVLAALLVMVITGVSTGSAGSAASSHNAEHGQAAYTQELTQEQTDALAEELEDAHHQIFDEGADPQEVLEGLSPVVRDTIETELEEGIAPRGDSAPHIPDELMGVFVAVVGGLVLVIFAVVLVLDAFVFNPLLVGTSRFFAHNLNQAAEVKELAWGYDRNYRETVKTMFFRDLYTVLWGILLVVPGVVKAYEYCMIPYLLADDPTMTKDEAFARSKAMMAGNKWRAFVLDLSFLGWDLLGLFTLGMTNVFYVAPYKNMTKAALYEELRYGGSAPAAPALEGPTSSSTDVPVPPFAAADAPTPSWDEAEEA